MGNLAAIRPEFIHQRSNALLLTSLEISLIGIQQHRHLIQLFLGHDIY
ncbi:MAG: hypothetical protein G8237_12020 [Magnetococcales bacterium]|nr:hypothetical protein [Magnetococcales bacterium]NGZ07070.1 hypothetical protein [Magnetococcales bacterium]